MNLLIKKEVLGLLSILSVLCSVLCLVACGNNSSSDNAGIPAAPAPGTCATGSVYSPTYGCLTQSNCQAGFGLYNNQCVSLTQTTINGTCAAGLVYSTTYGCLAQANCSVGYGNYNGQCVVANGGPGASPVTCQSACNPGFVSTQFGCLPQNTCQSCYGFYNNTCIPSNLPLPGSGLQSGFYPGNPSYAPTYPTYPTNYPGGYGAGPNGYLNNPNYPPNNRAYLSGGFYFY